MTLEDDLLALERRVLEDAAGDFLRAVAELRRMLAGDLPGIGAKLAALAIPEVEAAGRAAVEEAYRVGGDFATDSATVHPGVNTNELSDAKMRLDQGVPKNLTDALDGLDSFLKGAHQRMRALLTSGSPPEEAAAPIFQAATTVRSRVITGVNDAANQASETVGEAVRSAMVWEAERDACVYCLALAGEVVEQAGDDFPLADKYADGATARVTVQRPALHQFCRCRLAVLVDPSYAEALQREAQRSILRGFSLQSESNSVRVKAAERLLADPNLVAPKSVKKYAVDAVKQGSFHRSRAVPEGGPRLVINGGGTKPPTGATPKPPTKPAPEQVVHPPTAPRVISTAAEAKDYGAGLPDVLSLADHAKDTMTEYSGAGAYAVNKALRAGGKTMRPETRSLITRLDALFKKSATHEDVVVTRALDGDAFGGVAGLKDLAGKVFEDKGFLSTSLSDKPLGTLVRKQVRMSITVPKGTPAIYVGAASQFKAERELLLGRGLQLMIESSTYNSRSGSWIVKATVVPKPAK